MSVDNFMSLAHEIRVLMGVSTKLMMHNLEEHLTRFCPGMSVPAFGVLRNLQCHSSTIKELSERMLLAPSTLVPIVDRLEKESLVIRGKDPEDRRRTPLMLTDRARHMLAEAPEFDAHNRLGQALQALGLEKSQQLSRLLQELVTQMSGDQDMVLHVLAMSTRFSERAPDHLPDQPATPSSAPAA